MSSSDYQSSASQVPLVKTCQSCAKAKLKCYRSKRSDACDRCLRLHKECHYRPALRQNNATRSDPRIESLQSEVGSLKDQLQQLLNDPRAGSSAADSSTASGEDETNSRRSLPATARMSPGCHDTNRRSSPMPEGSVDPPDDVVNSGVLSMELADHLLSVYRESMVPHFPFVPIGQEVNATYLREAKPFLFLAIVTVACFDNVSLQKFLCQVVKDTLSLRMIQNGEVSFEILQGLLVYLAWSQYHPRPLRFTQYLSLALSITVDLRLDRSAYSSTWKNRAALDSGNVTQQATYPQDPTQPACNRVSWGTDDLRVVTGLFYLSSSISLLMQKLSHFQHSAYVDWCAEQLSRHPEYPCDKFITHIVQLQHLQEKINDSSIFRSHGPILDLTSTEMSVTRWKSDLQLFRDRLPFNLTDSDLLNMQYRATELYLYQIHVLLDRPVSSAPTSNTKEDNTCNPPPALATQAWPAWRIDILKDGFVSAKSLLDLYIDLPLGSEKHFSNPETVQIARTLTAASKLFIVAATAAGKNVREETLAVRHALDLSGILERIVQRLRALESEDTHENEYRDVFYYFGTRVEKIARWFEHRFNAVTGEPQMKGIETVARGKGVGGATSGKSADHGELAHQPGASYQPAHHPDPQAQPQLPTGPTTQIGPSHLPPHQTLPQSTFDPPQDPQQIQDFPIIQQNPTYPYPSGPHPTHNLGLPLQTAQHDMPINDTEMPDMLDPRALDEMMMQFMDYPVQMQMPGGSEGAGGGYAATGGDNGGNTDTWGLGGGGGWS